MTIPDNIDGCSCLWTLDSDCGFVPNGCAFTKCVRCSSKEASCKKLCVQVGRAEAYGGCSSSSSATEELAELLACEYTSKPIWESPKLLKDYYMWGYGPDCELPTAQSMGLSHALDRGAIGDVEIRHVAEAGLGLFAASHMLEGNFIGEYAGLVRVSQHHNSEDGKLEHDPYALAYPSAHPQGLEITARRIGGIVRCVNHASGAAANAAFVSVLHHGILRVICVVRTCHGDGIAKGTQILADYGAAYWKAAGVEPTELT